MKIKNIEKRLISVFILIIFMLMIFLIIKRDDDIIMDSRGNSFYVKTLKKQWEIREVPSFEMSSFKRDLEHMRALNGTWEICEVQLPEMNILEYMKDGMENPVLLEYYQEGIQDVYDITISKYIMMRYYDVDLNDDGQNEFIVIIQSSLHSGALGDSFDILSNIEESYIDIDSISVLPLLGHNCEPIGELFVLNSSTNGYRDLEVICEGTIHFYLVYSGRYYMYVTEEEWVQKTGK